MSLLRKGLIAQLPTELHSAIVNDGDLVLRIPAASDAVGNIEVFDEQGELTVVVGKLHHAHFESPEQVLAWIEAILAGHIRFRTEFSKGCLINSSSWDARQLEGGPLSKNADEHHEYLWTGEQ